MSLVLNGTTITTKNPIKYNGNDVYEVIFNGNSV